ncbi:MAG: hypothetical protein U1F25_10525 [Rubrivivax sp.]
MFALAPLGDVELGAALRREADRRAIFLSDEVMDHLLTHLAARPCMPSGRAARPFLAVEGAPRHGAAAAPDAGRGERVAAAAARRLRPRWLGGSERRAR